MLILDKRRAIERIMALSEGGGQFGEVAAPKGARQRVAVYVPHRTAVAEPRKSEASESRRRVRRRPDTGAAFPV
jgi:hypothetical protein